MRTLKNRPFAIKFSDATRTEQAHANDVDINQIMAKAQRGEHSDYIRDHGGEYLDATSLDYYEAQVIVANANSLFEDLPSSTRNRFDNKPALFLDFVQDDKNLEEMYELKLATRPLPPPIVPDDNNQREAPPSPPPTPDTAEA